MEEPASSPAATKDYGKGAFRNRPGPGCVVELPEFEPVSLRSKAAVQLWSQNELALQGVIQIIAQKVSAWAAIAAAPTIITGIYGMNFRYFPELDWRVGYPLAIVLMITAVLVLRWNFQRIGWL